MGRLPGTFEGRTWTTVYVCQGCAEAWTHVEFSPVDDEPHGLPFERRWCDCGGFLVARTPDYDRTGDERFH